jgi:DNA-binding transcriptional LysR family regulator
VADADRQTGRGRKGRARTSNGDSAEALGPGEGKAMIHSQRLAIFATIVEAGSISRAALELGCDKSVVSRQLTRLEAELGSRLIQRTTRGMALTEIGTLVLHEARQIDNALARIERLTGSVQRPI